MSSRTQSTGTVSDLCECARGLPTNTGKESFCHTGHMCMSHGAAEFVEIPGTRLVNLDWTWSFCGEQSCPDHRVNEYET